MSYFVSSLVTGDTSTLSTPAFTPSTGELIVVKAATWSSSTTSGTPSGGSLTYAQKATAAPGGFNGYCTIFTAPVSSSPGSMTVTLSAPSASSYHSMVVERWSNASVAATPATNSTISGSGAPSATITTTAANSVLTWLNVDENSNDPSTRSYLSGATDEGVADGHVGSNSVQYYAFQTVTMPGSYAIGMSSPNAQAWTMLGIEILDVPAATNPGAFMPFFDSL